MEGRAYRARTGAETALAETPNAPASAQITYK
jgi:hypothetical protein